MSESHTTQTADRGTRAEPVPTDAEPTLYPQCPPWCRGHLAPYFQMWDTDPDGHAKREHNGHEFSVGMATAQLVQDEDADAGMEVPRVYISAEMTAAIDTNRFTAGEARVLGERLVALADELDRFAPHEHPSTRPTE